MVQFIPQAQIRGPRQIGIDQNALAQLGQAGQQFGQARQAGQIQEAEQATLQSVAQMAKQGASTEQISTALINSGSRRLADIGTQALFSGRESAANRGLQEDRLGLERERVDIARSNAETTRERTGLLNELTIAETELKKFEKIATQRGGITDPEKRARVASGLRKEFTGLTKGFRDVRDAFGRMQSTQDTPAGDISLVISFMKMLDPGSVVREGEFATAEETAGVPARIRNKYNNLIRGDRLDPKQRLEFKNQGKSLFKRQKDQFEKTSKSFRGVASRVGVSPENVVIDFTAPQPSAGRLDLSGAPQTQPNQQALQSLRENSNNPDLVRQFDEKFGPGAAEAALGLLGG